VGREDAAPLAPILPKAAALDRGADKTLVANKHEFHIHVSTARQGQTMHATPSPAPTDVAPAPMAEPRHGAAQLLDALRRLRPALIAAARRQVRCPHLAEDVVQDAVLRILAGDPLDGIAAPEAYLHRMVRNLAIDRARRLSFERRLFVGEDQGLGCPASCASRPDVALEGCEALRAFHAALAGLPEQERTAFALARVEGVPQKEIAVRLGLSPARICGLVRRGEERCAQALGLGLALERTSADDERASRRANRPRRGGGVT
jgi:RNA polymerase sigma factor (sigma-70 family)